jgi:hypothetical protein
MGPADSSSLRGGKQDLEEEEEGITVFSQGLRSEMGKSPSF